MATVAEQRSDNLRPVVLAVDGLQIVLDPSGAVVDDEVTFRIRQGEILGLVGESASGKTTAATSLLAHQRRGAKISGGHITIDGRDVLTMSASELRTVRGGLISYVPQDSSAALNPALRIGRQLVEILRAHKYGSSDADRQARVAEMMAEVLLPTDSRFLRRYPHQLSGGQQQRVAIAMAFANRPKVIVLDEPTTALDVTTQAHVLNTIRDLTRSYGVAALYVTHDLAVVANLADRIAVMYAGRVVEIGTTGELFDNGLHPYTRKLLASIPDITGKRALRGIPGWAPRPGNRPQGCAFSPRCTETTEGCEEAFPPIEGPSDEHRVRCWSWEERERQEPEVDMDADAVRRACSAEDEPMVTVEGLTAFYQRKETIHDIDVVLRQRQCLALVGESGSGKTTLARCIAGLHPYNIVGDITFQGDSLARDARDRSREIRQAIQYIFQSPYSSLNPRKTIRQIIAEPLNVFFSLSRDEMEARMVRVLEKVALDSSLLGRYPDQLSGGERQRIAIARGLAAEPSILICDEVTSWLDVSVQAAIIELLAGLQEEMGLSMLFVTHNLALVRSIAQDVAVMSEGRIVEYGLVDDVLDDPKADYTKKLLSDTPTV